MLQNLAVVFIWFRGIWHRFHLITACDTRCPYWKLHFQLKTQDPRTGTGNWALCCQNLKKPLILWSRGRKESELLGKKKTNPHLHVLHLFITSLIQPSNWKYNFLTGKSDIATTVLEMRKMRLGMTEQFVQGCTAIKWWILDLNLVVSDFQV